MEKRYQETHKTWDRIAELYERSFMDLEIYNDSYKQFCDFLSKPEASILEIGCGPGNITKNLMELNPKFQILATDVSRQMIRLAKKNNPGIKAKVLDCRDILTIDNHFDGIICGFTIPYLSKPDCEKLISDCFTLLEEGGLLYLSFVEGNYEDSAFITGSTGDRTYFYYHQLESIKKGLRENQLEIVDYIQIQYKKANGAIEMHTIMLARK